MPSVLVFSGYFPNCHFPPSLSVDKIVLLYIILSYCFKPQSVFSGIMNHFLNSLFAGFSLFTFERGGGGVLKSKSAEGAALYIAAKKGGFYSLPLPLLLSFIHHISILPCLLPRCSEWMTQSHLWSHSTFGNGGHENTSVESCSECCIVRSRFKYSFQTGDSQNDFMLPFPPTLTKPT